MDEASERFVKMFQSLVGAHLDLSGKEYAAKLKEQFDIKLPANQAKLFAKLAIEANNKEKFKRYAELAMEYFRGVKWSTFFVLMPKDGTRRGT